MDRKEKNKTTSKRAASSAARVLNDRNASADARSAAASALSQAPDDDAPATEQSSLQQPNVKLAGEAEPLGAGPVTVGMATLGELPNEEQQRAGFYFPAPQRLIRLFPARFKLLVTKG